MNEGQKHERRKRIERSNRERIDIKCGIKYYIAGRSKTKMKGIKQRINK